MRMLSLLPWPDWLALGWFFSVWVSYSWFTKTQGEKRNSLIAATNRYRGYWMQVATSRDPRVLDGIIAQNLSSTPAFFSSTTIIVIGGLFALLGSTDKATELVRDIPFAQRTSVLIFDLKVLVMISIFVFSFFRFSWSMRQYTFVALLIGSMPDPKEFEAGKYDRELFSQRAGRMLSMAAETFNDGLRGYYFAFAVIAWFFSPFAFALATAAVVMILYSREYRSDVLEVLG
ncbi:DUF599 domain-containing protein [Variovorax sp. PCZ-1]|uniref:DUF599 domain-containing protein n=1 Tax=Variovorax sp. PCZ-1 TaxID=2835533 RepID=UPI001BCDFC71|nr:DUF599 domain-containing protein [Variovorax sp. PCZ-1]MBS7806461.1 DUF599 domain-containing protein [Variovorax sp. PCZ-1]